VLHDEYCYQIQTRMLTHGRLWMPKHELSEFFDSFHLITDKVFAVKYTPGTAMVNAPAVAAGLPFWVTPLLLSAASVGLLYLVLTALIDGLAGVLGALMLLAGGAVVTREDVVDGVRRPVEWIEGVFRKVSIETLSQPPMLFWLLLAAWAFLHWRRNRGTAWLVVTSAAVGMGAITRPVDAVSMALPLAVGAVMTLWRARAPRREWARTAIVAVAAVAPFLLIQLACDKGMTGSFAKLPWIYYAEREDPYDTINPKAATIAEFDVDAIDLAQKRKFVESFSAEQYKAHAANGAVKRIVSRRLTPAVDLTVTNPI
jgi:hypothetical protein